MKEKEYFDVRSDYIREHANIHNDIIEFNNPILLTVDILVE